MPKIFKINIVSEDADFMIFLTHHVNICLLHPPDQVQLGLWWK